MFPTQHQEKYELWRLVGPEPVRFSLIEFEHLTGLNCAYIENFENPRCEVTKEMASFWERIGVSVDAEIFTGFIKRRKYSTETRASLARLITNLEKFENYPWGRVAFQVLVDSLRAKDFTKSHIVDGFIQVLQTRMINYVEKDFREMFPKWNNDIEHAAVNNIIKVMFNAPPSWKWTMNYREDAGTNPWTNPKTHIVNVKEESFVNDLVVREEVSERPSKKARIEAPTEPHSESLPEARSEARSEDSISLSGVDKVYIEKCFKDLADVMRVGCGTSLGRSSFLGIGLRLWRRRWESPENKLPRMIFNSIPQVCLNGARTRSESVNGAKARHDDSQEPSCSKGLSVEAKEKEVKEAKEKEVKEKARVVKEKEVKEAKEKEVKEKARVALEKEVKEKKKVALEKALEKTK
ncbi:hypothetical protein N665_0107s0002 [Sinapis alba]|nr:hypothetical protein N665_0107s0002 [Sinapis alba]